MAGLQEPAAIARLGHNIVAARQALGLTQEDVYRRSDVHPVELSRIEHGKRDVRVSTLLRLARALETTPEELLRGTEAS